MNYIGSEGGKAIGKLMLLNNNNMISLKLSKFDNLLIFIIRPK